MSSKLDKQASQPIQQEAQQQQAVAMTFAAQVHQGPLPDPATLERYEKLLPGAANRFMNMAENEQAARHEYNRSALDLNDKQHTRSIAVFKRGQLFGLISVALVVMLCFYAFFLGYAVPAATIAVGVIAAVGGVFIFARQKQNNSPSDSEQNQA